ncbi:hypothetical protein ATANTOWER_027426 [Ataeniobius toweri]|uniref:Uncharacterized protein n=1 Tax=Ataeniobius toweri TaxID=208326 RepID=A0ABU7C4L8_9TELE|nr:hypothetical protein [Ataeniobius toweri]
MGGSLQTESVSLFFASAVVASKEKCDINITLDQNSYILPPSVSLVSFCHSCSSSPLITSSGSCHFPSLPQYSTSCFIIVSRWILLLHWLCSMICSPCIFPQCTIPHHK